jgi:hypothetical protein
MLLLRELNVEIQDEVNNIPNNQNASQRKLDDLGEANNHTGYFNLV